MKQVVIVNKTYADKSPDGYSSLGVDSHHQTQNSRDLTYLEPVSGNNGHYDEIKENDERHGSKISATNENEIPPQHNPSTIPHSESFPFPTIVDRNTNRYSKRNLFSTNSL